MNTVEDPFSPKGTHLSEGFQHFRTLQVARAPGHKFQCRGTTAPFREPNNWGRMQLRIRYLNQPLDGVGQRLGDQLNDLLRQEPLHFERVRVIVAFAKSSGVSEIEENLRHFRVRGGDLQAIVGISHRGTSKQALESLMDLCDRVIIYHNPGYTFHPKFYFFDSGPLSVAFIGSGNLTGGGLYTNYEHDLRLDMDHRNAEDAAFRDRLLAVWETLVTSPGEVAQQLDGPLLEELVRRHYVLDEELTPPDIDEAVQTLVETANETERVEEERGPAIFRGVRLPAAPHVQRRAALPGSRTGRGRVVIRRAAPSEVLFAEIPRGSVRWNQANFDQRNFIDFFHADTPGNLRLWHVGDDGRIAREPEIRPGVTVRSRNFRIELGAAAGFAYPAGGRPIAVFVSTGPREFRYMLLLPGTRHYRRAESILTRHVQSRPNRMRRVRIAGATAIREWPNSPLWSAPAARA